MYQLKLSLSLFIYKSNQMSLPNVRFAVKNTSVTPPSITGRYQCTTQADRDVGYREWFKTVPAIYHDRVATGLVKPNSLTFPGFSRFFQANFIKHSIPFTVHKIATV